MATIKEIAQRAKVSIGTVDRVIHDRGKVSPEKEAHIRDIIKELGFKPNVHARQLKLAKRYLFGVLMPHPHQDNYYWSLPARGIALAWQELASVHIEIRHFLFDKHSEASFQEACVTIMRDCPDGLLIAPVLAAPTLALIEKLPPKVPYAFFDSTLPGTQGLTAIWQDAFQSGVLAARLMDMLIGGTGAIAIITFYLDDFHLRERERGFSSYFKGRSAVRIASHAIPGGMSKKRLAQDLKTLTEGDDELRGIFVTNALAGSIAAALPAGRSQHIRLVGYDLIEENITCLRRGLIDFIIDQKPEQQGYKGIYALFRHVVMQEHVEPEIMMPLTIVTRENVDYC
jgi:LacI family transcriptional regulator